MLRIVFLSIVIFFSEVVYSQNDTLISNDLENSLFETSNQINPTKKSVGELLEVKETEVDLIIDLYNEQCKSIGYKVQLYSGKSKVEATKVKSKFLSKYNDELASAIIYKQPNFKLRVGNFKDRLTAIKYLELLKTEFPTAFIVQDEIQVRF